MVFVAPVHPLWWVVRRSIQLLTGAVMLAAMLSSGHSSAAAADPPVTTVQSATVSVAPVVDFAPATHAAPAVDLAEFGEPAVHVGEPAQPTISSLTEISVPSGRLDAAPGERAPPRL